MKIAAFALAALLLPNATKALGAPWSTMTCAQLEGDTRQAVRDAGGDGVTSSEAFRPESPLGIFIRDALSDLDDLSFDRVTGPFGQIFVALCFMPEDAEGGISVQDAFDQTLQRLMLDQSKPRWGLIPLPDIDMSRDSCQTFIERFVAWQEPRKSLPINDVYGIQLGRFAERYDVSDPAVAAEFQALPLAIAINAQDTKDEPCFDVMERLLAEKGVLPQ
ncbi:MAG: hypothetical protein AAFQ38_14030 [Pseudomonadota bacterium]